MIARSMHNMRFAKASPDALNALDGAVTGVLGFTAKDGTPRSVAITPYVVGGHPTVTTTLALLTKAKMLRNRPAAALFAGGVHVQGDVDVRLHRDAEWFDANIRESERLKYPPAAQLLAVPFHRRLLWWYVGRISMTFRGGVVEHVGGADRVTITTVESGRVTITPLAPDLATEESEIVLGADVADGPASLLVHHETDEMAELLSLTLRGEVRDNTLLVAERRGSLEPQRPSMLGQLRGLRRLARLAKANRPALAAWNLL